MQLNLQTKHDSGFMLQYYKVSWLPFKLSQWIVHIVKYNIRKQYYNSK